MTTPSLQELQKDVPDFDLNNQQWLILHIAAGTRRGRVSRRHGWNRLRQMGLLDEHYHITSLGKMVLNDHLEEKLNKKEKFKLKDVWKIK